MCTPTTCSGVWLMGYHLGHVRNTEAAGESHKRRPQCRNRKAPTCTVYSLLCQGNTTACSCPAATLTAAPPSTLPMAASHRAGWQDSNCSSGYGLVIVRTVFSLLILDFPLLILSLVACNELVLYNVPCNIEKFNF